MNTNRNPQTDDTAINTECPGCGAEPGEPCRFGCLSHVTDETHADTEPMTTEAMLGIPPLNRFNLVNRLTPSFGARFAALTRRSPNPQDNATAVA